MLCKVNFKLEENPPLENGVKKLAESMGKWPSTVWGPCALVCNGSLQ
jgi:hypothetical protein